MLSEENAVFSKNVTVPDADGIFSQMASLFYMMQVVSTEHVDSLQLGGNHFRELDLLWVLNRMQVQIHAMPVSGQCLRVQTWPNKQKHGLYSRQYRMEDAEGNCLLQAVSIWTLLNGRTRTMHQGDEIGPWFQWQDETDLPLPKSLPIAQTDTVLLLKTRPEEIDSNGHINNTNYVRWIDSVLPDGFNQNYALSQFQINYLAELRQDDKVELHSHVDTQKLAVEGFANGKRSFAARGSFIKK